MATSKDTIARAVSVLRVSSKGQADEAKDSLGGQRELAETMAEARDWDLVGEYAPPDGHQSGRAKLEDRGYIQDLLAAAARSEFDVAIFKNPTRGSRDVAELVELASDLRDLGVFLAYSETGHVLDWADSMDQIVIFVGGHGAEMDWSQMLKNQAGGRYGAAKSGRWVTGRAPMGFAIGADKFLVIDPAEAEVIRYAFEAVLAGSNIQQTTAKLNARYPDFEGKRSARGFAASTVGGWLRKPAYAGRGVARQVRKSPTSKPETLTAPTPAIVSVETFEAVQVIVARGVTAWRKAKNVPKSGKVYPYALAGGALVHVHPSGLEVPLFGEPRDGRRLYRCGHSITKYKTRWQDRPEFDPCKGWSANRQNGKARVSTEADAVEAFTILRLAEAFESEEALAALQVTADRRSLAVEETRDVLAAAVAERDTLAAERANLVKRLGRLTDDEAETLFDDLEARTLANEERVARLEHEAEALEAHRSTVADLQEMTYAKLSEAVPGDRGDQEAREDWATLLLILTHAAEGVLVGRRETVPAQHVEWLAEMVRRFDVRVYIQDDESDPAAWRVWVTADEALTLDPNSKRVPSGTLQNVATSLPGRIGLGATAEGWRRAA